MIKYTIGMCIILISMATIAILSDHFVEADICGYAYVARHATYEQKVKFLSDGKLTVYEANQVYKSVEGAK